MIRSDLHVVLVDPHRPGDETSYHPGEANLRMADLVIINKVDSATPGQLAQVQAGVESVAKANVPVILADSVLTVADPDQVKGKRILVVGDGPPLTHGGMAYGATDPVGLRAEQNKVHVHDLHATILHLLGINHEHLTIFHNGRDERLTDVGGSVVTDILA